MGGGGCRLHSSILLTLIGLTAAVKAAGWLVDSGCAIADRKRISYVAYGAVVLGLVASIPEAGTALGAARLGRLDLAVGHAFSSASANLCLAVAAAGITGGLRGPQRHVERSVAVVLAAGLLAWAFVSGEGLTQRESSVLLLAGGSALIWWLRSTPWTRRIGAGIGTLEAAGSGSHQLRLGFAVFLVIGGAWVLDRVVVHAAGVPGTGFASPVMVGAALCSALPEAAVAVIARARGVPELSIGVVAGASVLNLTVVTGIAGLIAPGPLPPAVWGIQAPLLIAICALLFLFSRFRGGARRAEAVTLVVLYIAYLAALLR